MLARRRSSGAATDAAMVCGIGAGPQRGDADDRKIDGWQARDRQEKISDGAEQKEREGEQRRADRPSDERRGDVHSAASWARAGLRRASSRSAFDVLAAVGSSGALRVATRSRSTAR